ncbi:hypothetical protein ABIF16_009152 [Bradyrhizobium elkanii]
MLLFSGKLASGGDDLFGRYLHKPLLSIFVLAGERLLFVAVRQVQTTA